MYYEMVKQKQTSYSKHIVINATSTAKTSDEVKNILKSFKVQDAVGVIFVNLLNIKIEMQ